MYGMCVAAFPQQYYHPIGIFNAFFLTQFSCDAVDTPRYLLLVSHSINHGLANIHLPPTTTFDSTTPTPYFQNITLHSNYDPNHLDKFSFSNTTLIPSSTTDSKPCVIATIQPINQPLSSTAACNYILDPAYPILEPANTCYSNPYFGRRPGIWEPHSSQSSIIANNNNKHINY